MPRMIGFMATWTTYGTWLQGNKRGYVNIGKSCGYSVGRFKKAATKALRKYEFSGMVWTSGFDKRYCYHQYELETKIQYVRKHES